MIEHIKKLFFEQTLKHWHFEDIVKSAGISRERANFFLKKLLKDEFILRIKSRGKMPYYVANRDNYKFRFEKKLFGLNLLEESGLLNHLNELEGVSTAIVFGSFSRGDWNKSSDIDLFIYGRPRGFEKGEFEAKLKREIQIFAFDRPQKIKRDLDPKLIPNIAQGFYVKGNLLPFRVEIND